MNEHFLTVFTQENIQYIPDREQIFGPEDSEKLQLKNGKKEIDRLKKFISSYHMKREC